MSKRRLLPRNLASALVGFVQRIFAALDRIPYWLIALATRVFPACHFPNRADFDFQDGQAHHFSLACQATLLASLKAH